MKKRLVSFVLMLLLVLTPLTSFAQSERTLENVADSPKALSFKTTTLDGKPYSSDAIKNYDLVVLNVWAEWCGPCVWELPFLQKIYENYKNVLVLGLWWGDSVEEALETANEAGVKYPLIHSTDALDKYLRKGGLLFSPSATACWGCAFGSYHQFFFQKLIFKD